jgi:hypothetical protein
MRKATWSGEQAGIVFTFNYICLLGKSTPTARPHGLQEKHSKLLLLQLMDVSNYVGQDFELRYDETDDDKAGDIMALDCLSNVYCSSGTLAPPSYICI